MATVTIPVGPTVTPTFVADLNANFTALQSFLNTLTASPLTTRGDLWYFGSVSGAVTNTRLPLGANSFVLTSNGTDAVWSAAGGSSSIVIGTTPVSGGTTTRVLFDNGGTAGEYAISGTGSVAMTISPVFTTPNLGTPSAVVLTNGTGLPVAGIASLGTGVAAALTANVQGSGSIVLSTSPTLTTPALGTPSSGTLTNCTADGTNAVGFRQVPQNSESANYTTVLADGGKHIYHPSADTSARTWTIDSNANVAYPVGTAITFVNDTSGGTITIAITSDTLVLAGAGSTGSRTLAASGVATAIKMTTTRWMISGTGLT